MFFVKVLDKMKDMYLFFLIIGILAFVAGKFNIRILLDLFTIMNPIEFFFGARSRRLYCIIIGCIMIVLSVIGYIDLLIKHF